MSTIISEAICCHRGITLPVEPQEMALNSSSLEPPPLPPRRSTESLWSASKRFFQSAPWTGTVLILFTLTAIGVLADVDAIFLRILLTWTLVLLGGAWCLAWILPKAKHWMDAAAPPSETPEVAKPAQSAIPLWIMIGIAGTVGSMARSRQARPVIMPNRFVSRVQHEATERYWNATVASLHKFRFDSQTGDGLTAADHVQRSLDDLQTSLRAATAASKENVDSELLQLVERHLKIDQQTLALSRELVAWWEKNGRVGGENSAGKNIAAFEQFMLNATDEDIAKLPSEVRSLIAKHEAHDRLYDGILQEILVLQIRLQERYKPNHFALPPIAAP